jgi:hypothetical protein
VQVFLYVKYVIEKHWERQSNIHTTFSISLWNVGIFNYSLDYTRLFNIYDENLTFFKKYVTKIFGITELVNKFKKVFYIFQNINHKSYLTVQAVNVNNIFKSFLMQWSIKWERFEDINELNNSFFWTLLYKVSITGFHNSGQRVSNIYKRT